MSAKLNHLAAWHHESDRIWTQQIAASLKHYAAPALRTQPKQFRSVGLIFFNPSLRTRTSMEVAAARLGAHVTTIVPGSGVWGFEWNEGQVMDGKAAEHVHEAFGVLSRYYDTLGVRVFASGTDYAKDREDALLHQVIRASTVPVISLESAFYHPCQALADAATLHQHFDKDVVGKKFVLAWGYHPKALPMAVPNSALLMASRLGMQVTVARPNGFELDPEVISTAAGYAKQHGQELTESDNLDEACKDADVIYVKAWGGRLRYQNHRAEQELRDRHKDWRLGVQQLGHAAFMHCLPVRRGVVVDEDVLYAPGAIHLLQAEFRLYAQMAILERAWT
ncbi:MAG: N-acetylornithine carbamoyltransferase [Bacteroidota bacterium]|nr:N-acetylornithine carbamoyltransferase [Bacteroidota bacterium]MDE2955689.1 N-acetylornithine carbamoyltransferase [Bacteroidota bacterium]